jgi:hypothetical protein
MMNIKRPLTLSACLISGALMMSAGPIQAWTVDFEADGNGANMVNGQVLDNEYASSIDGGTAPGLTISGDNFNSCHPDLVVAFDTRLDDTRDADLESPFTPHVQGGSDPTAGSDVFNALRNPGNIAVVQENGYRCGDGVCNRPDDEAYGGIIRFVFDAAVTLLSLDVFDIDGAPDPQNERGWIRFYDTANSSTASHTIDILGNGGNNHSSRIVFAGLSGITDVFKMEVQFSSSGGLSNLIGANNSIPDNTSVPAPATLALFGLGLLGVAQFTRRSKSENSGQV